MARELAQILQELDAVYKPQKDQYTQAIQSTDPALAQEEAGLQAAKQDAFQGITDQANRRGLFYSGMPIAEQARYTGAQFLPALANLRARYAQQKFDLTNALNKVTENQYNQAYGIRQNELDLEEKQREFDRQLAAQQAAARASGSGGGGGGNGIYTGGGGGGKVPAATVQQRSGGGFNFQDSSGNSISAARYAQLTGQPIGTVLQQMAAKGDKYAASVYNQIANFARQNPGYNVFNDAAAKKAYSAIFWGT